MPTTIVRRGSVALLLIGCCWVAGCDRGVPEGWAWEFRGKVYRIHAGDAGLVVIPVDAKFERYEMSTESNVVQYVIDGHPVKLRKRPPSLWVVSRKGKSRRIKELSDSEMRVLYRKIEQEDFFSSVGEVFEKLGVDRTRINRAVKALGGHK